MDVLHDSRSSEYRAPYGAVAVGTTVALSIDVWDAPSARLTLRTWTSELGERRYPMRVVEQDGPQGATPAGAVRHQVQFAPETSGIVWYHFIVELADGRQLRYGAADAKTGGRGCLRDWEPPSFQLTVYDDPATCPSRDEHDQAASQSLVGPLADYLLGRTSAYELAETIEGLRENYPAPVVHRAMRALERPSDMQLMMLLSGLASDLDMPDQQRAQLLDDHHLGLAKGRLWCASLIQELCLPSRTENAADENAEDAGDAFAGTSRQETTTEHEDEDCTIIADNARDLHDALPLFRHGSSRLFAANDDVLAIWREGAGDEACQTACLLVNRSIHHAHDVLVPLCGEAVSEVIAGYDVPLVAAEEAGSLPDGLRAATNAPDVNRYARVHLHQLGSAVLYFHPEQRLQKPLEPGLGVLAHITSVPVQQRASRGGEQQPGTLGAPARAFVDWLARAGVRYWQVLPANPTDEYGSPYAGISAFAGNMQLLEGRPDLASCATAAETHPEAYRAFCERESDWLEPYAAFMAIRHTLGKQAGETARNAAAESGKRPNATPSAWQDWPQEHRTFRPSLLEGDTALQQAAEAYRKAQFAFDQQWRELRAYANERGVRIVGDMPIYVSADSADVWANPELFQLGDDGRPALVAGCPPDRFAAEGQIWGNPVYDWGVLRASGFDWWLRRLQRAFELYDIVRLDHFIGFSRYFSIPADAKATAGAYRPGPGLDLFRVARKALGALPVIAEDLGSITPAVRALVAACGFPGMDIVQFVDGNDPLAGYRPRPDKIAYTGTHDNQTLRGYAAQRYPDLDDAEAADALVERVVTCSAPIRIVALQDVLGLGDDARMNVPGTAAGNWTWQACARDVEDASDRLRKLAQA